MERKEVYEIIDSERSYQDVVWAGTGSANTLGNGSLDRTLDEFCLYIKTYADDVSRSGSKGSTEDKLNNIRKVAGLCVAAMEAHGGLKR